MTKGMKVWKTRYRAHAATRRKTELAVLKKEAVAWRVWYKARAAAQRAEEMVRKKEAIREEAWRVDAATWRMAEEASRQAAQRVEMVEEKSLNDNPALGNRLRGLQWITGWKSWLRWIYFLR